MRFKKLFTPFRLASIELRNRIVMPPMGTWFAGSDGKVNQELIHYYGARAKGGAGLIIIEGTAVQKKGKETYPNMLAIYDDSFKNGFRELVQCVHHHGAKIAIQLTHSGRTFPDPKAESRIEVPLFSEMGNLEEIEKSFIAAAVRARECGFDAIELHGAHGYLIAQSLSPYYNKRKDRYGINVNRGTTFAIEIINGIKQEAGNDFPIIIRISSREYIKGGLELEAAKEVCRLLEKNAIDAIHVSVGTFASEPLLVQVSPMYVEQGHLIDLAAAIKGNVGIPVIGVGRIKDPIHADEILEEDLVDLISMGRALIADPDLPNKANLGKFEDIRKCIGCNQGCIGNLVKKEGITCTVNPEVGQEGRIIVKKARRNKRVMVIGGGPAGLQVSSTAAKRGHSVNLFEKEDSLGGQLLAASVPPKRREINDLVEYLIKQVQNSGVSIKLGTLVTLGTVKDFGPDIVCLCTGATSKKVEIPGLDKSQAYFAIDVLKMRELSKLGRKIIIVGGGIVGLETADYLSEMGKKVYVIEILRRIGSGLEATNRFHLMKRLNNKNVEIFTLSEISEIRGTEAVITCPNEKKIIKEIDSFVIAVGSQPNISLLRKIKQFYPRVYRIGDSLKPRTALESIQEGFKVGLEI